MSKLFNLIGGRRHHDDDDDDDDGGDSIIVFFLVFCCCCVPLLIFGFVSYNAKSNNSLIDKIQNPQLKNIVNKINDIVKPLTDKIGITSSDNSTPASSNQ